MPELLNEILSAWDEPATRHAMIIHLPIVLSMLGFPLAVCVAIRPKNHTIRWTAVVLFAVMAVSAHMALLSGSDAEAAAGANITIAGNELLHEHEEMGEKVRIFAAALAFVLAMTAFETRWVRSSMLAIAVLGSAFIATWVGVTAHYGGQLVYQHGVGIRKEPPAGSDSDSADETSSTAVNDPRVTFFVSKVRPLLDKNCWGCHNPVRAPKKGELDLTTMAGVLAGGETSPAVIPGDVEGSLLIQAVRYEDPFLEMPPPKKGRLSPEDVAILEQWVRMGAVWQVEPLEGREWASGDDEDDS